MNTSKLHHQIQKHAAEWGVIVERTIETETSVIAFGSCNHGQVVLKVVKQLGDEWTSGEILQAFDGHGVVRIYEQMPGAVLMERLRPGDSLVRLVLSDRDEVATGILARIIEQLSAVKISATTNKSAKPFATVQDWSKGFERYIATGDAQIPKSLVIAGQQTYLDLCASQRDPRLLHGDLHHYNVLFDSDRGWVAIDPKGVIGEIEYEIGAALRNPIECPELFLSRGTIERRLKQFTNKLNLDFERALAWTFAQSVLSAIWEFEDGFEVNAANPSLRLANEVRPMLGEQYRS